MRSRLLALMAAPALMLAGCSAQMHGPTPPPAAKPLSITYATGPCFGFCPVYTVTVSADGTGRFNGALNTSAKGPRDFKVSPAQFKAFADALAPWRPVGDRRIAPGEPGCKQPATDLPSVTVDWKGAGPAGSLYFYYGCGREAPKGMANALGHAPDALPIAAFIGEQP